MVCDVCKKILYINLNERRKRMTDIDQYLKEIHTALLTEEAFEHLKEKADKEEKENDNA